MRNAQNIDPILNFTADVGLSECGRYAVIRVDALDHVLLTAMANSEAELRVDFMKRPPNLSREEHVSRAARGFFAEYLVRIAFYQEAKDRYLPPPNLADYTRGCLYDFAIRTCKGMDDGIAHENGVVKIDVIAPNRNGGIGIRRKHVPPLPGRAQYQVLTSFQTDGLAVLAVIEKDKALEAGAYFADPLDVLSLVEAGAAMTLADFMYRLRLIPAPCHFEDLPF